MEVSSDDELLITRLISAAGKWGNADVSASLTKLLESSDAKMKTKIQRTIKKIERRVETKK